jgi:5'-3' exonuclease
VIRPIVLIDAGSLLYRAYHAIPVLHTPDGKTPTNAVLGFLNFLARLLEDRRPGKLVACLDADWRPAFRVEALPTYKAHRVAAEDAPVDETELQVPMLLEILDAVGLSVAAAEGYEAEDVIATLARGAREPVEVVTGDRDLFALVGDPNVRVLYTLRGVSELAVVDRAWVEAKYGIPGDRYLDFAILRGDPSDGLPGVPGIGAKTASELLRRYGSLEGILGASDLPAALRAKLLASGEYLIAACRVVGPVATAPVRGGDGAIPAEPRDLERLAELGKRYGLERSVERIASAVAAHARA